MSDNDKSLSHEFNAGVSHRMAATPVQKHETSPTDEERVVFAPFKQEAATYNGPLDDGPQYF